MDSAFTLREQSCLRGLSVSG